MGIARVGPSLGLGADVPGSGRPAKSSAADFSFADPPPGRDDSAPGRPVALPDVPWSDLLPESAPVDVPPSAEADPDPPDDPPPGRCFPDVLSPGRSFEFITTPAPFPSNRGRTAVPAPRSTESAGAGGRCAGPLPNRVVSAVSCPGRPAGFAGVFRAGSSAEAEVPGPDRPGGFTRSRDDRNAPNRPGPGRAGLVGGGVRWPDCVPPGGFGGVGASWAGPLLGHPATGPLPGR
ncbi:hypothetical protein [Nocardia vaccinii]|uniref:hypothetical protein n=1 Tax=Nocardia vaccinii TaxID=1822 RepID=UPI00082DB789|nr:hypothetical protein [Nocardia vaccinii]